MLAAVTYLEINLIFNILLLGFLAVFFLTRHTGLFLTLVAFAVLPFIFEVPRDYRPDGEEAPAFTIEGIHGSQEDAGGGSESSPLETLASGDAVNSLDAAGELYGGIAESLGADVSQVRPSLEEFKKKENMSLEDRVLKRVVGKKKSHEVTFGLGSLLRDMVTDPEALWLFVRVFWILAALYLYLQERGKSLGLGLMSMNVLPVPYLMEFLPYAWYQLNENNWVKVGNYVLDHPKVLSDALYQADRGQLILPVIAFAFVMGLFLLWKGLKWLQRSKLEEYLNPEKFQVEVFEEIKDFKIRGSKMLISGMELELDKIRFDNENPKVWYLGSGTRIEFKERAKPEVSVAKKKR